MRTEGKTGRGGLRVSGLFMELKSSKRGQLLAGLSEWGWIKKKTIKLLKGLTFWQCGFHANQFAILKKKKKHVYEFRDGTRMIFEAGADIICASSHSADYRVLRSISSSAII